MSELFKSAFSSAMSWGSQAVNSASSNDSSNHSPSHQDNPFVGQTVEVSGNKIKIERVVAEGGFGFVFKVRDGHGKSLALKRLVAAESDTRSEVENEIRVLKMLQPHPHVMTFISYGVIQSNVYLLLTEFCSGSLSDFRLPIEVTQVLSRVCYQTSLAVNHMHSLSLIHRDIKIENILFDDEKGVVKLCDFGSTTDVSFHPDLNWTPIQRSMVEEEMQRKTTPMYRPPEILDTYLGLDINHRMDVWAFGCLVFTLKFGRHPFEDSAKLRIINCNYSFPKDTSRDDIFVSIIESCLKVDPKERTDFQGIIKKLEENFVDLNGPVVTPKVPSPVMMTSGSPTPNVLTTPVHQSSHPGSAVVASNQASQSSSLSGVFTKYLKESTKQVMQSVSSSIIRQDLDMTFLTPRLLVMSFPAEGIEVASSFNKNHVDDVRAFLEYPVKRPYGVVNVSGRSYGKEKFGSGVKIFDAGLSWKDVKRPVTLSSLISLVSTTFSWLKEDDQRLLVIHCLDGKSNSAFFSSALLLWSGIFEDWSSAYNLFSLKRGCSLDWMPSHQRYLSYIGMIGGGKSLDNEETSEYAVIHSITLTGIPLFTKLRDGCRPFLEVFMNNEVRIGSTMSDDYERMRVYNRATDSRIFFKDLKMTTDSHADLSVFVSHARASPLRLLQSKNTVTAIKMLGLHFNLDFERRSRMKTSSVNEMTLVFKAAQLDVESSDVDRFPRDFSLSIQVEFVGRSSTSSTTFPSSVFDPEAFFETKGDFEDFRDLFPNVAPSRPQRQKPPARPPPPRPAAAPTDKQECRLLNLSLEEESPASIDLLGGSSSPSLPVKNSETISPSSSSSLGRLDLLEDIFAAEKTLTAKTSPPARNASTPNLIVDMMMTTPSCPPPSSGSILKPAQVNISVPLKPCPVNGTSKDTSSSKTTTTFQSNVSAPKAPHYSRSFFDEAVSSSTNSSSAKVESVNQFEDLLQGFTINKTTSNENRSMAQLKNDELVSLLYLNCHVHVTNVVYSSMK